MSNKGERLTDTDRTNVPDNGLAYRSFLGVQGIEVTQAIQTYRSDQHLDHIEAPDNSVPLVAKKTTWVRVYVRSGLFESAEPIHGVTGTLTVLRPLSGGLWGSIGQLPPINAASKPVTAEGDPDYKAERSDILKTLNFVIPKDWVCGDLRLSVEVTAPRPIGRPHLATHEITVNAMMHQTLKLAGIMIGYKGPNAEQSGYVDLPAPTIDDLQTTAAYTLKTRPISEITPRIAGQFTWQLPLTDHESVNWEQLGTAIVYALLADGNKPGWIYYALWPCDMPGGIRGFTSSMGPEGEDPIWMFSAGPAKRPSCPDPHVWEASVAMSHEIGHQLGYRHAPGWIEYPDCPDPNCADPNYPDYAPHPTGSIGEFGLDIDDGTVLNPKSSHANMGNCPNQWASLYFYQQQLWHSKLHPKAMLCHNIDHWSNWKEVHEFVPPWVPIEIDSPPERHPGKAGVPGAGVGRHVPQYATPPVNVIAITGQIDVMGRVTVNGVARVAARPVVDRGFDTGLTAQLRNATGDVISQAVVYALNSATPHGHHSGGGGHSGGSGGGHTGNGCCGCGDHSGGGSGGGSGGRRTRVFLAFLRDVDHGECLCIVDKDHEEHWRRTAPKTKPKVQITSAAVKANRLSITWSTRVDGDTDPQIWVQFSVDQGKTWSGLGTGLTGKRATLNLASVPPGRARFQVLVHDGFSTGRARTGAIRVPPRDPSVAILHPQNGQHVPANSTIRLYGHVDTTPLGKDVDPHDVVWLIDNKRVARGTEVCVTAPDPGEHTCTLVVKGAQRNVRTRSTFFCLSTDDPPQRPVK